MFVFYQYVVMRMVRIDKNSQKYCIAHYRQKKYYDVAKKLWMNDTPIEGEPIPAMLAFPTNATSLFINDNPSVNRDSYICKWVQLLIKLSSTIKCI